MPKATSESIRKLVISHRDNGMTIKDISNFLKIHRNTVRNILKHHTEMGTLSTKKNHLDAHN